MGRDIRERIDMQGKMQPGMLIVIPVKKLISLAKKLGKWLGIKKKDKFLDITYRSDDTKKFSDTQRRDYIKYKRGDTE